jgi:hypothetical protein
MLRWLEVLEDKLVRLDVVKVRLEGGQGIFFLDCLEVVVLELGDANVGTGFSKSEAWVVCSWSVFSRNELLNHLADDDLVLWGDCHLCSYFPNSVNVRIEWPSEVTSGKLWEFLFREADFWDICPRNLYLGSIRHHRRCPDFLPVFLDFKTGLSRFRCEFGTSYVLVNYVIPEISDDHIMADQVCIAPELDSKQPLKLLVAKGTDLVDNDSLALELFSSIPTCLTYGRCGSCTSLSHALHFDVDSFLTYLWSDCGLRCVIGLPCEVNAWVEEVLVIHFRGFKPAVFGKLRRWGRSNLKLHLLQVPLS